VIEWLKFIAAFIISIVIFGIAYNLTQPVSCLSYSSSIWIAASGCFTQYTIIFLVPFVIGLVISLLISLRKRGENKKSTVQKLMRGLLIAIPIAIFLIYLSAEIKALL